MILPRRPSPLIYLASPYDHPDLEVRKWRIRAACEMAAKCLATGHNVFSPIAHSTPIVGNMPEKLSMAHSDWMRFDLAILSRCDEIWVLKLEGWEHSKGVMQEIAFAEALGLRRLDLEPQSLQVWHVDRPKV